jgi:hypothetical protein
MPDDRVEAHERLFRSERRLHARAHAVRLEELRYVARVDEDVVVAFIVAAPRAVLVGENTAICRTNRSGSGSDTSVTSPQSSAIQPRVYQSLRAEPHVRS